MGKGKILPGPAVAATFPTMSPKKKEPTFEEALKNLEALVASMESGDVPLATLVEKFEEGSKLVKTCEERLKQAELKIEKLRQDSREATLEPFTPDAD
jgi:exodeoxyribonuclease VII small subunit